MFATAEKEDEPAGTKQHLIIQSKLTSGKTEALVLTLLDRQIKCMLNPAEFISGKADQKDITSDAPEIVLGSIVVLLCSSKDVTEQTVSVIKSIIDNTHLPADVNLINVNKVNLNELSVK